MYDVTEQEESLTTEEQTKINKDILGIYDDCGGYSGYWTSGTWC